MSYQHEEQPPPNHQQYEVQSHPAPYVIPVKKYTTAVLLSVFLGIFGADRLYLGHKFLGYAKIAFTIFTWSFGFIMFMWWAIDIILIVTKRVNNRNFVWDSDVPPQQPHGPQQPSGSHQPPQPPTQL